MKAHWWSCVLGLLFMPAEVILHTWTVSQKPLSISQMRVNSSAEIACSTSLSDPLGLYLQRQFHGEKDVMYLSLHNGQVTKNTTAAKFRGRIHVTPDLQIGAGYGFTLRLSLLALEDTDMYYCTWTYFKPKTATRETKSSNGTIIIVREKNPQRQCKQQIFDLILISLSAAAFAIVLSLLIGALIFRCKQFNKQFRPARAAKPPRHESLHNICPQNRHRHCSYVTPGNLDFKGIL